MQIFGTKEEIELIREMLRVAREHKEEMNLKGNFSMDLIDTAVLGTKGMTVEDMVQMSDGINRDRQFNTTLQGYVIYSMVHGEFSRADIDRMLWNIENHGFDDMTLEEAKQYQKDIWSGKVVLDETNHRPNRILTVDQAKEIIR